ncbi:hypothetical protein L6452_37804 [Arctium lappa]|uniref:Uncharacterized protein n=1 Tax=Arctium lappa TaxID=4217 RepID=A0ACB8Y849_ARCLA|nr:hypothetical protein L6452_37804 [Arctium lappa]
MRLETHRLQGEVGEEREVVMLGYFTEKKEEGRVGMEGNRKGSNNSNQIIESKPPLTRRTIGPTLTTDSTPKTHPINPQFQFTKTHNFFHKIRTLHTKMITVAIPNSPVFSPSSRVSSSIYCKSSPESLILTHSPSSSFSSHSSAAAFKFRLQKPLPPASGLVRESNDGGPTTTSPTLSKRKRPTKLAIPVASFSFSGGGAPSLAAAVEDRWKEVEVDGDGYSVYCKRGKRDAMEDRFKAVVEFNGQHNQAFFGVFDGHGGSKAAEFAAENLDKNILNEVEKRGEIKIIEAIKQGYMNTDSEFLNQDHRGGSCCLTAIIRDSNLVVSNAGDCRAVVSSGGVATPLTADHRPSRPDEKLRIESLGGYVDCSHGVPRVLGSLAVSRGIGDRTLKQWITSEPESKILKIVPEFEFMIMASDGLWDKVSNQEAIDLARPFCVGNDKLEPLSACKKLVELSASRGSNDDASVMIVQLHRFCS